MIIIGITGKSGSGKSTISDLILKRYENSIKVDIDKIGHKSTEEQGIKEKLVSRFGSEIIVEEKIDRKKLGDIVFSNIEDMEYLEKVTWNFIKEEIEREIKIATAKEIEIVILDWALLPKTEIWNMCNIKLLVTSKQEAKRKAIILKRDNITKEYLERREEAGLDYSKYSFDEIIENTYDEKQLEKQLEKIYKMIER